MANTLALVGVTGAVGEEAIRILNSDDTIQYRKLFLFASPKSAGKKVMVRDVEYEIIGYERPEQFRGIEYVILMTPSKLSKEIVEGSVKNETTTFIDNSSCFRMGKYVPLVVPEVNMDTCRGKRIIANPNCSTIILLMSLYTLYKANKIKSLNITTFQAISGAGAQALEELEHQASVYPEKAESPKVFPRPCMLNVMSHNSPVDPTTGYNGEEMKMINEVRKILNDTTIEIEVTCMRVPVRRCHTESVTVEFENPMTEMEILEIWKETEGLTIVDSREKGIFPDPLMCEKKSECMVGRLRKTYKGDGTKFQYIVVGDQLGKGAALNALQIYHKIVTDHFS